MAYREHSLFALKLHVGKHAGVASLIRCCHFLTLSYPSSYCVDKQKAMLMM